MPPPGPLKGRKGITTFCSAKESNESFTDGYMKKYGLQILLSIFLISTVHAQTLTFSKYYDRSTSASMGSFRKQAYDPAGYWFFIDDAGIMKVDAAGFR